MKTEYYTDLRNVPVFIQCTWANAFTEPEWDRGLCIASFDRGVTARGYAKFDYVHESSRRRDGFILPIVPNQIGWLTGNYAENENNRWMEVQLIYANRRRTGWMRYNDIKFEGKTYTVANPDTNTDDTSIPVVTETKKSSWGWIVGAISLLSILK